MRLVARLLLLSNAAIALAAPCAGARDASEPIRLVWIEGDVAGQTPILPPDGGPPIGVVEYHQHLRGDVLDTTRVSRFADGSSDEDTAVARVGRTLVALRGRSIIRDRRGRAIVDIAIDVPSGRITGFYDDGTKHDVDLTESLDPSTYWGPLIFLVVKNFDANVEEDRVRFRTIVPTPRPRVLTMELVHDGERPLRRMGAELRLARYLLRPTFGWMVDPIVRRLVPSTEILVEAGAPPSLARYTGPRNYAGQEIRLQ
jgi:hypothetical protein